MVVVSYRFQSIVDYLTNNASNFRRSPHVSGSVRKRRFEACFPPDDCAETIPKRLPPPTGSLVSPGHEKSELPLSYSGFFLPRTEETGFQLTSSNVFRCPSSFLVTRENVVYVGTEGEKGKNIWKYPDTCGRSLTVIRPQKSPKLMFSYDWNLLRIKLNWPEKNPKQLSLGNSCFI